MPVTVMNVKSLIALPADGGVVDSPAVIQGVAWTGGEAVVTKVEVKLSWPGGGMDWVAAEFDGPARPYAWRVWRCAFATGPGQLTVRVRATDSTGATQPESPALEQERLPLERLRPGRLQDTLMTTRVGIVLVSLTLGTALAAARHQDPEDEAEAKELGRRAFVENCLICHGEEMTSRQRLTAKQWTAEVDKMIGWGAPVPADQKALLLKYVGESFSEKVPPPALALAPPDELLVENAILATRPTSPRRRRARRAALCPVLRELPRAGRRGRRPRPEAGRAAGAAGRGPLSRGRRQGAPAHARLRQCAPGRGRG